MGGWGARACKGIIVKIPRVVPARNIIGFMYIHPSEYSSTRTWTHYISVEKTKSLSPGDDEP